MKGIYLTEEGKHELEANIAELKEQEEFGDAYYIQYGTIETLEEILKSAIILPVEKSWEETPLWQHSSLKEHFEDEYRQGVIIQPKQ